jgi:hypothetical protein
MPIQTSAWDKPLAYVEVPGFAVLLDPGMNEVVPRQECVFDWQLLSGGGASFVVTSGPHEFDIRGKAISFLAVGAENQRNEGGSDIMFVSIVAARPVQGSVQMVVGKTEA